MLYIRARGREGGEILWLGESRRKHAPAPRHPGPPTCGSTKVEGDRAPRPGPAPPTRRCPPSRGESGREPPALWLRESRNVQRPAPRRRPTCGSRKVETCQARPRARPPARPGGPGGPPAGDPDRDPPRLADRRRARVCPRRANRRAIRPRSARGCRQTARGRIGGRSAPGFGKSRARARARPAVARRANRPGIRPGFSCG